MTYEGRLEKSREQTQSLAHVGMIVAVKKEFRLLFAPPRDAYTLLEMYPAILKCLG